jgi:initiation factor 1A
MVKNTTGGNKAKKGASKDTVSNKRVRLAESSDEIYGVATKMLGGGKFHVKCNDNIERLCTIGGKFRGKHKQSNFIKAGTWVLVGLRTWETVIDKMAKCDLLECYSDFDKDKLLQTANTFTALEVSEEDMGDINFDEI